MAEGIKLLHNGKPFTCECGCDLFKTIPDRDEWECNGCGARFNGRDAHRVDFPKS